MHSIQNMQTLLWKIDKARKHMNDLAKENPLTSEVVINASTKLDKLLNKYTALQNQTECEPCYSHTNL